MKRIAAVITRNLRISNNPLLLEGPGERIIPVFLVEFFKKFEDESAGIAYFKQSLLNFKSELKNNLFITNLKNFEAFLIKGKIQEVRILFDVYPGYVNLLNELSNICNKNNVKLVKINDFLTNCEEKPKITTFKNFYSKYFLKSLNLNEAQSNNQITKSPIKVDLIEEKFEIPNFNFKFPASEEKAKRAIDNFVLKNLKNYAYCRDYPHSDCTSKASIFLNFGIISYRYLVKNTLMNEKFLQEIAWSEFNRHIMFQHPSSQDNEIRENWKGFPWQDNFKLLRLLQNAETGYPIVDAGTRELNETGFMHNRVRMIVASFLTKNLLINWREGEKFFRKKLIDYDPSQNSMNWQWVAGCGLDAAPYFRIFNPILQAERFDPDCLYIKKWIPELKSETAENILKLRINSKKYPVPIVDLKESRAKYLLIASSFLKKHYFKVS